MKNIVSKTFHHRGIDLKYQTTGEGPILMLMHGANGSMSFIPVIEELSKKYQVILPDHPGFGNSTQADWIETIPDLAYFYLDIFETMDLDEIHLVGHSMGGWISAEIVIRNTHRIKSLTLVSSAGINIEGTPMGDLFSWSQEEAAHQVFARKEFINQMLTYEPNQDEMALMQQNRRMAMLLCQEVQFQNPEIKKWAHRLTKPTLILWGDSDGIFPEPFAHAYHDLIPNSELEIFKDCGHVPMAEAREDFILRLVNFLEQAS